MRKRRAVKRDVLADPIYSSKLVTKIINTIMKDGKKGIAQTIFYDAMNIVKEKVNGRFDMSEVSKMIREKLN